MKFTYELKGIGWADVYFEIGNFRINCSVSYLTDALGDLVNALLYMLPGCVPEDEVSDTSSFEWHFELSGILWTLKSNDKTNLDINIIRFDDIYEREIETGEIILDSRCELKDFIEIVVKALDNIIKKHGIVGYKDSWYKEEFPLSGYLKLKSYLKNEKLLYEEETLVNSYRNYCKSNINEEVGLILSEI